MPKRLNFDRLRAALDTLKLEQAKQLQADLIVLIEQLEQQGNTPQPAPKVREVVEVRQLGDRLYQLERVRCGKAGCKCQGEKGQLHGPYWYAYWRTEGKLKSRYVGKQFRAIE
ncbi:MAG: hypothetical protein HC895_10040 [Leptolyngbyaceae cyanobacterium SM1_3_5]|nr:hypothetical protein [Leptolyngbyaceae cyanobacterium SM1_3_5]